MTDKEKIRTEIERLYNQSLADEYNRVYINGNDRNPNITY